MGKWIAHGRESENASYRVICFPFAGGTASNYSPWKAFLSEEYSICPVLYPGRERRMRDKMPESLEELAKNFAEENEELFSEPFIIMGQCTGATVAYEVVREIEKMYGKSPVLFVASGAVSPSTPAISGTSHMSDEELLDFLLKTERVSEEATKIPMFMDYYFPIMKADFHVLEVYKYPGDYKLPCPLLTVEGSRDDLATGEEFEKWKSFAPKGNKHIVVEGGHFFLETQGEIICKAIDEYVKEI
ncbi:MAG: hypothetical protein K6G40_05630 [Eubacterium sp.]|nr:hypothetical protein [Eubacterium sp.]